MDSSVWQGFVGMTLVVSATPGPNMLLVMGQSVRFGMRAAMATMVGCMVALLGMVGLSALGLGALLHASPLLFRWLCVAGAAYLAYLGWMAWRNASAHLHAPQEALIQDHAASHTRWGVHARQGFWVAASNPKAIVFAAAFFPQFIRPGAPALPQFALLLATFSVIEIAWYFVYALCGQRLAPFLQRPQVRVWFDRATGVVFMGFALLMVALRSE